MEHTKEKRRGQKFVTIALSILAGILIVIGILTSLILSSPNADKINRQITPSDDLAKKAISCAVTSQECTATADEVNSYLESRRLLSSTVPTVKGAVVKRVILSFNADSTADAYIPVGYMGKNFDVSVNLTPSCNTDKAQIAMRVNAVKIGRLPVNPAWAMSFIKDALPAAFSVSGTDIYMDSSVFKYNNSGVTAELSITGLKAEKDILKIKTKAGLNTPFFGIFS